MSIREKLERWARATAEAMMTAEEVAAELKRMIDRAVAEEDGVEWYWDDNAGYGVRCANAIFFIRTSAQVHMDYSYLVKQALQIPEIVSIKLPLLTEGEAMALLDILASDAVEGQADNSGARGTHDPAAS
jgi:hypothetical protein